MPSKKKKYNARFPAGRIKKIMQTDEEVGKVAQAVPIIISRTLELFVESLLTKTLRITNARNAKTLSPSHMKQCIISESRFDFLRDLVHNIPDISMAEDMAGSESGFVNEATSPISTSSSSNGGSVNTIPEATVTTASSSSILTRSESCAPSYLHPQNHTHSTDNKRVISHTNSLNFYKEIDDTDDSNPSFSRQPPPKLTRLNSAPAASTSTHAPYLNSSKNHSQTSNSSIQFSIPSASQKIALPEPILKMDFTNLQLPMSMPQSPATTKGICNFQQEQPTIKIDLSNFNPTVSATTPQPQRASASSASPSTSVLLHQPTIMPSVYSNTSSTIPGMDEDYDDI